MTIIESITIIESMINDHRHAYDHDDDDHRHDQADNDHNVVKGMAGLHTQVWRLETTNVQITLPPNGRGDFLLMMMICINARVHL